MTMSSDQSFAITMAIIFAIMIILIVAIVAIFHHNWRVIESKDRDPFDGEEPPPNMWKVTNILDQNQLSDKDFKRIHGMSRNAYVKKHYGNWRNVDPLDRFLAGNITQEEYESIVRNEFSYKEGGHMMRSKLGQKQKRNYGDP